MNKKLYKLRIYIISTYLLIIPFTVFSQEDSRYATEYNLPFNQQAGNVNPQTGNVTVGATDLALPGRGGMGFSFSRIWSLNQSNVYSMNLDSYDGSNYLTSETIESYNHMGAGWSSNIPYIFEEESHGLKFLFFGGNVYELETSTLHVNSEERSNLRGYDLLDMRIYTGGAGVNYTDFDPGLPSENSHYILLLKDNSKYYFREDGKLMMQEDRTGLNRIWYFYEEYEGDSRLSLVVDTIGREIEFSYDAEGNLESVSWEVMVGWKDELGVRSYRLETRTVYYSYEDIEEKFPEVLNLNVADRKPSYLLASVTDTEDEVVRYEYELGLACYSYDSSYSHGENAFLLLKEVINNYRLDSFKNKRCFEYDVPTGGLYTRLFYSGYMEYYKVSRQYVRNRHDEILNDTHYVYYEPGVNGNYNEYSTVITAGNVNTRYIYSLSDDNSRHQVLDRLEVETEDGFLCVTDFSYNNSRAKLLEEEYRAGRWVYTERYEYDAKGNLRRHVDRVGLVTSLQYDSKYSIPIEEVKTLYVDGELTEYRATRRINEIGQITAEYIYVDNESVLLSSYVYDEYGNVVEQEDAEGNVVYTEYDAEYHMFPVKSRQYVTIANWFSPSSDNWLQPPDELELVEICSRSVFNTDGTVWLEIDNEGYAVEHYYDSYGNELETVNPGEDRITGAYTDIYGEYLADNLESYFNLRVNNPGVVREIDYGNDFVKSYADIDVSLGHKKATGVQGDGLGNVEQEIEYEGNGEPYSVKRMEYDSFGRMIALTDPDAGSGYTEIEVNGKQVRRYDKTWLVKYDDLGRTKSVIYPDTETGSLSVKEVSYDDLNNSVTVKDPEGRRVKERMDWNGNVIEVMQLGDSSTEEPLVYRFTYDALGRKVSFTDAMGIVTEYRYDERSLLIEQDYGSGSDLMEYNELGQLVSKEDRKGQELRFFYDELGRNTSVEHYAANGELEYVVNTVYDLRGNAVRIDNGSLIEYYEYDHSNRVVELKRRLKDRDIRELITDRVWGGTEEELIFSFSYEYNDAGMVTAMSYPDGSVHGFEYDGVLGRLESISAGAEDFVDRFDYSKSGVVERMDYANGTYQEWDFDNRKRISGIRVNNSDGELLNLSYTLNRSGDILAINDNEYGYDGFDRLVYASTLIPGNTDYMELVRESFGTEEIISVSYNPAADLNSDGRVNGEDHSMACFMVTDDIYDVEEFEYDKNGNRTLLVQNGDEYRYEYGERNRLERVLKDGDVFIEYGYDENGNTLSRTVDGVVDVSFTYDTMNRLVRTVEGDGEETYYYYDNAGNRFIKQGTEGTTVYLRHGQLAVAMDLELLVDVSAELGRVNRYVLSGDLLAGRITRIINADLTVDTEVSYYHLDHLNSTKCVTDENGVLEVMYEYRAFGEQLKRLDAVGNETDDSARYSYSGKELDANINLYYFNARYYDATIGRFINVDPIQDGTNWYVYCSNNPLSIKDPTGLSTDDNYEKMLEEDPCKILTTTGGQDYVKGMLFGNDSDLTELEKLERLASLCDVKKPSDAELKVLVRIYEGPLKGSKREEYVLTEFYTNQIAHYGELYKNETPFQTGTKIAASILAFAPIAAAIVYNALPVWLVSGYLTTPTITTTATGGGAAVKETLERINIQDINKFKGLYDKCKFILEVDANMKALEKEIIKLATEDPHWGGAFDKIK